MTEVERFVAAVRAALGPEEINRSGATLYSAARTLQSGDVYLLGTNPGGADIGKNTIAQSLEVLPTLTSNSYLDEAWDKNPQAIGQAAMQRRVKALLEGILQEPAEVCASNLIFMRTPSIGQLDFWKSARICWPAHEVALDIVQPRLLIAFGNSETSTYAFLHAVLPMVGDEVVFPADHGNWSCRGFHSTWRGQPMYVAGLPHLSYYALLDEAGKAKEHVISWLLEKLRAPATNK